ncbi:membrane-associated protein [Gammaproteobacteria bacterium]
MGESVTNYVLSWLGQLGYASIFILMAAESSILPVPSELVMAPAGYLVATGKLNFWLALLAGNLGSIVGSLGSYYLALWLGRPLLLRFGHYCFISEKHFDRSECFVRDHGEISLFTGRFVPGVRHLISMPAGLARMPLGRFILYTFLGSGIWNAVLLVLGYLLGGQQTQAHWSWVVGGALFFAASTVGVYVYVQRRRKVNHV